ncbi:MAG: hypothetical protein ACJ72W_20520 [Actinoallomurus sp.]
MIGRMADVEALQIPIRRSGLLRNGVTQVLSVIMLIVAPVAVITALVTAVLNFSHGAIAAGVLMLVMAIVLTGALLVPAIFFWSRFVRRDKPADLVIDHYGLTVLEGGAIADRLPWEKLESVRLSQQTSGSEERLVVTSLPSTRTGAESPAQPGFWMSVPLSDLQVTRAVLSQTLLRHAGGRYRFD